MYYISEDISMVFGLVSCSNTVRFPGRANCTIQSRSTCSHFGLFLTRERSLVFFIMSFLGAKMSDDDQDNDTNKSAGGQSSNQAFLRSEIKRISNQVDRLSETVHGPRSRKRPAESGSSSA